MINESFALKIELKIEFDGNLQELGKLLTNKLSLPDFWYDTSEDPPHVLIGYCEFFGFELEIFSYNINEKLYLLKVFTTDSFDEIANKRIYDLSVWYSKYISYICKLKTFI